MPPKESETFAMSAPKGVIYMIIAAAIGAGGSSAVAAAYGGHAAATAGGGGGVDDAKSVREMVAASQDRTIRHTDALVAPLAVQNANINQRLDRIDQTLDRIEQRQYAMLVSRVEPSTREHQREAVIVPKGKGK